jgi:hypothetical protein
MKLLKSIIFKSPGLVLAFVSTLLLQGCSTATLFSSYPSQLQPIKQQTRAKGELNQAITSLKSKAQGDNLQLYGPELGRLQQFAGDFKGSLATYAKVIDQVRQQQLEAKVRLSHFLTDAGSLMVNDNVIPYRLSGYEIVYLYYFQALNYLGLHDLTNAVVSVRRAVNEQTFIKQQHADELAQVNQKMHEQGLNFNPQNYKQFSQTMKLASETKNDFENGFGYYLASVLFAAQGDLNNAIVSAKNALGVAPDNRYVQQRLLDLLRQQGSNAGPIAQYEKQFGHSIKPTYQAGQALLVVIDEQDFVTPMHAISVPVPLPGFGGHGPQVQQFSFPVYNDKAPTVQALSIHQGDTHWGTTQVVVRTLPLAAHSLKARYPLIFLREALRFIAKMQLTQKAQKDDSVLGLIVQVYSLVSDQADLRSWLTLPSNVQVMQHYAKPGKYRLGLSQHGRLQNVNVSLQSGKTTLLWVIDLGNRFIVHTFLLT